MKILITYDLKKKDEFNYELLIDAIKKLGVAKWVQYSTWAIETPLNTVQVGNKLLHLIHRDDSLFVTEISNAVWSNIPDDASILLKSQPRLGVNVLKSKLPTLPSRNQPFNRLPKKY